MSAADTDPSFGTDLPSASGVAASAAPTEVAASEPVAVESEPAHEVAPMPAGDALPTVADFIAPLGGAGHRGEVALDAKALEVSFTRSGGDVSFSVKAETVTLTGKRG